MLAHLDWLLQSMSHSLLQRPSECIPRILFALAELFQISSCRRVPWDNLVNWLKSGSGCYWIDGKAGSGKSTLLKYISDHSQTRTSLRTWAGGRELAVSSFYFWNLDSPLQKSQSGLLRALLFNLLEPRPTACSPGVPRHVSGGTHEEC